MQCNYCNRDFACVNDRGPGCRAPSSRPSRQPTISTRSSKKIENIEVVGIAGPGDPFANGAETMETLRLVRESHPDMMLCVATNGLELAAHVESSPGWR